MKIVCSGAGPAGLYLAIGAKLRDPSNDVTVYERNPPEWTYGWGMVFWDHLLGRIREHDGESARAIEERSFRWCGLALEVAGAQPVRAPAGGYGIGRRALIDVLVERAQGLGVEIEFEREVADVTDLGDADLVVAADGASSRLRGLLEPEFEPTVRCGRNTYVWLGTTRIFDAFTFAFAETEAGWIWFHAYAVDAETSTVIVECSPQTWAGLGLDVLAREDSLRLLEGIFAQHLAGHPLLTRTREADRLPWLTFRRVTNRRWSAGNVVLVGDAAHTTHFSIGSGTRLAIEDAIVLAHELARRADMPSALAAYERDRRHAIARAQREARRSARWFENVPRYAALEPQQLLELLQARRSALLHVVPPRAYYQAHRIAKAPLGWLRTTPARRAKALASRST
jgi:anthraniloyl-CoA monooxygenase